MEVALLERRVGDPYLNEGLWRLADEGGLDFERKAVLEDNGFRVGQVGGVTDELLTLLTSERSCANPRLMALRAGGSKELVLGPVLASCRFRMPHDGDMENVTREQAQMAVAVVPTLTADGRISLHFTPLIHHGAQEPVPMLAPDRSGHILQWQQPTDRYTALSWDITVGANEYVVVGARSDRPQSLGYQAFVRAEETPPLQRLLVIRANRNAPAPPDEAGDPVSAKRAPSLAYQASYRPASP
jgi:hypothetical protein